MQLEQQFTIPTDVAHSWSLLNDVERIAPCFPGATVTSATGDSVDGRVKVKLGPVMLTYAGVLRFLERDEASRRLVMDGQGTDAKGNGSASARVTAQLSENPDGSTRCELITDLNVTGRPAQFGRGMMLEVGNNVLGKFSTNLARMLAAPETEPVEQGGPVEEPAAPVAAAPDTAPLDLLNAAGAATAKRLAPLALVAVALVALLIRVAARGRRSGRR